MSDQIRETAAEVAALIPRYSWEIMDEDQRDALMTKVVVKRYMKVTKDGVKLTPSWWGETLGTTMATIKDRQARLKASDQGKRASARPGTNEFGSIRSAKAAIKKFPELAQKLLDDTKVAEHVGDAVLTSAGQTRTRAKETDQGRHLDAEKVLLDVESAIARALRKLPDYRATKALREEAEYAAGHAEAFATFVRNWANGISIADEVEQWMAEEAR